VPLGVTATFVNNVAKQTMDLKLVLRAPVWAGQSSSAWDTSTLNWIDTNLSETAFADGDPDLLR
jgi:hypothetical protein